MESNVPKKLSKLYEEFSHDSIKLIKAIRSYWKISASSIFSPVRYQCLLQPRSQGTNNRNILTEELEQFIFNNHPELHGRSTVCRKVFKIGEFVCYCLECGMHNNAVLCINCFMKSEHRFHLYKLKKSDSCYCCNCGDVDAWKQYPCCEEHPVVEAVDDLPDDVKKRMYFAMLAIIRFAEKSQKTVAPSDASECTLNIQDDFCLILNNKEECYNISIVSKILCDILGVDVETARKFISKIDNERKAVIYCENFNQCIAIKNQLLQIDRVKLNFDITLCHASNVGCEIFGLKLLKWLQNILRQGINFRKLFRELVVNHQNIFDPLFNNLDKISKIPLLEWYSLLNVALSEYESKKTFAKIFAKNYHKAKNFVEIESLDLNDYRFSISRQLLTNARLSQHLIASTGIFSIMLKTLHKEFSDYVVNKEDKRMFIEKKKKTTEFSQTLVTLRDLRYLLRASDSWKWNDDLVEGFLDGLDVMLNFLTVVEGMDPIQILRKGHVSIGCSFNPGIQFEDELFPCINLLVECCASDEGVLCEAYRKVLTKLEDIPQNRVECNTVVFSFHQPLTYLFALLHLQLQHSNLIINEISESTLMKFIEPMLVFQSMLTPMCLEMCPLFNANLIEVVNRYRTAVTQVGASFIESNKFMDCVYHTFVHFGTHEEGLTELDRVQNYPHIINRLFSLLIVIIAERYSVGVGNPSQRDIIRRYIIQRLCIRPLYYVELIDGLPEDIVCTEDFNSELYALTDIIKEENCRLITKHKLRMQYYAECNVFSYCYDSRNSIKAQDEVAFNRKEAGKMPCCPPPKLLKLSGSSRNLVDLLQTKLLLNLLKTFLVRALFEDGIPNYIHKVLYLIGFALQEEESQEYEFFKFTEKAHDYSILPLLNELLDCSEVESYKCQVQWTIDKYNEVANIQRSSNNMATEPEYEIKQSRAMAKRHLIMSQIASMQKQFKEKNSADLATLNVSDAIEASLQSDAIATDPNESSTEEIYSCIQCKEAETITLHSTMVSFGCFQMSRVLALSERHVYSGSMGFDAHSNYNPTSGPHTSICGHAMHISCWESHSEHPADEPDIIECPICRTFSNSLIPLVPAVSILAPRQVVNTSLSEWLGSMIDYFCGIDWRATLKSSVNLSPLDFNYSKVEVALDSEVPEMWKSLSYTLRSIEVCLKEAQKPLLGHLTIRQIHSIDFIVRNSAILSTCFRQGVIGYASEWFDYIFNNKNCASIIEIDPVETLVTLTFSLPAVFPRRYETQIPNGNLLDVYTLQIVLISHLFQILVLMDVDELETINTDDDDDDDYNEIIYILKLIPHKYKDGMRGKTVWKYMQIACLPFLRCCVLFYRYLTNIASPDTLKQYGGDTFANMCAYLNLPQTPQELLKELEIISLITRWSRHPKLHEELSSVKFLHLSLHETFLLQLPDNFTELISICICINCSSDTEKLTSSDLSICLTCGEVLCSNCFKWKTVNGKSLGPCNYHLEKCTVEFGLFLYIGECAVLLLDKYTGGCIVEAPYVDQNGDTDERLVRGNHLRLCPRRYKKLKMMWLNHEVQDVITKYMEEQYPHLDIDDWIYF